MSKILWINPLGTNIYDDPIKKGLLNIKQENTQVDVVSLEGGSTHLEYRYYEALVVPEVLKIIRKAEQDKYDAAIIGCFYDLGLYDARQIVDGMVIAAPAEASAYLAATLGYKFSVIVTEDLVIPQMMSNFEVYGIKNKVASFKSLGMGVHDLRANESETIRRIKEKAKEAIENDLAEVIILGCTLQFGFYKEIQEYINAPVIDPIISSFKYAEYLVELKERFGWLHSKVYSYKSPPIMELKEFGLYRIV
ncbi:MAG: hydantoin racemase [Clostridia bacterium BRH_c25]|nr:MAG: hydantoin racemase [Clostridia bacterium BRH_c25]